MNLRISGKNMDMGASLRQKIDNKINDLVEKYFDGAYSGHVTVEKSGNQFNTDCLIHLDMGAVLQATNSEQSANASFDGAAERIEKRLRRYKRKLKGRHNATNTKKNDNAAYMVFESLDNIEEITDDYSPAIIAESSTEIRSLTVAMAVMQLDMTENPVVVFRNTLEDKINVVYRRKDGNIGWVNPENMVEDLKK